MSGGPAKPQTGAAFLPYGRQRLDEDDVAAVVSVLRGDLLTTGPAVDAFEAALAAELGAAHASAVSSGTAALHVAARALGIGPGDDVVVPAVTFLASANAFQLEGARIVFADVDPDSGLMGPAQLEEALARAPAARAVVPVHLNGQVADPEGIAALARMHGLRVVEDACHAIGARYVDRDGRRHRVGACAHADLATFSFHPVKTIAMGEGGAVTAADAALDRRVRLLRSHGMERDPARFAERELSRDRDGEINPWYYEMGEPGFNYRASDLHCALGLSQLGKLGSFVARRAELVARYDDLLAPLAPEIVHVARTPGCDPAWHLYVVHVDFDALGTTRGALMRALSQRGIGTQVHYVPVHRQPFYRRQAPQLRLPGAERYYARCLSLPLFVGMSDDDVGRVVDALAQCLELEGRHHARI